MAHSSSKKWILLLILLFAGIAIFWHFTRPKPIAVITTLVENGLVERTIANTRAGTIKACQRAKLSLPIGGQISAIHVKEGDTVKKGALLIELWNEDLKALQQEAELSARSAHLEHDAICIRASNFRREAERSNRLVKKKLTSEESADQARSQADAAAASCAASLAREKQAAAAIAVAAAALDKTRLRAPFNGIVAEVTGEMGEYATPSPPGVATPPAIDLLTNDCHYIVAPMDEVDAAELAQGLPARVSLDAHRGRSFSAMVKRIAPYILDLEKQARTVEVELEFDQKLDIQLFAGYSADVEIILDRHEDTLRIPTEALLDERFVLLFSEGKELQRQQIETGISNWRYTEVLSGLKANDEIVTSLGRDQVKAGVAAIRQ
ncbi:MAG: efflux RND transporter periplasmic adaptor subunit [Motiliproteus sp.]